MGYGPQDLATKVAIVEEQYRYLFAPCRGRERYNFPTTFWKWLVDGSPDEPAAACIRDVEGEEAEFEVGRAARLMAEQVQIQWQLHLAAPTEFENPFRWADRLIGKNKAHMGQLRAQELGIWANRRVHIEYRKLGWPADPHRLFVWRTSMPYPRPWLVGIDAATRGQWQQEHAVIAAEARAIGMFGRVIANAAILLKQDISL